ncbi:MAG: cytochrome b/b6 domain-containing protein [Proteobacteria bacterium]|nr:cytochrome b/b6 domain-containing protein [Pseudomonadota bacterium]MBU0965994.1 cytochrome b/b6 domain-containing protein [Pseudomonadota bacterium]
MNENKQIHVWDFFVRVFHWSLVLLFFVAYPTGDDKGSLHRYVGYAVLGLVASRIAWGFFGSKHALFRDFVCSPAKAFIYLKELAAGKPTYYKGHNPAAAWMIILLLVNSIIICLSGYAAYATKGNNPLLGFSNKFSIVENAYADGDEKEEYEDEEDKHDGREMNNKGEKEDDEADSLWSDIHEMAAQFMLVLIFLHIAGVTVSSIMHRENLLQSMITGKKDVHSS